MIDDTKLSEMSAEQLLRIGKATYAEGNYAEAHRIWKMAAQKDPLNEQIWLSILPTLERKEDRRVCLKNILEINPNNETAQTLLSLLDDSPSHEAIVSKDKFPDNMRAKENDGMLRIEADDIRQLAIGAIVLILLVVAVIIIVMNFSNGLILLG